MENQLTKINQEEVLTIDSREIAEMLGKEHKEVIRDIEGGKKAVGIIPTLASGNFPPTDYFIESSYLDSQNKTRKCYLCTKMGCEMLGNKQQGKKGILFTAKYVKRFNEMENYIKQENQFKLPQTYKEALLQLVEQVEKNEELQENNKLLNKENDLLSEEILQWADRPLINALVRAYSGRYNSIDKFAKSWKDFKKEILYKHSINLNARITNYLNNTGKKTKPRTLDMLHDDEIPQAISTIVAMCRENDIHITEIIKKFSEEHKHKRKIINN